VGAVFARPTAQNPLLRAGLLGLWLSYLFATLASATALVALGAPYLLGRELALFALPATLFWALALSLLAREAAHTMASERTQTRVHNG